MVHFNTIQIIQSVLNIHIAVHLTAPLATTLQDHPIRESKRLAANPVVETADDGTDFLWFWIDAGVNGIYRFGYNAASLYPSNLKCIQKLNPVSNTWQDFWKETE